MPEGLLELALRESVEEVLEKMFFVRTMGDAETGQPVADLAARLTFEGDPSGCLTLRIPQSAARSISADFLGAEEEDLSEPEIREVVCELANIICGSLLSRVESTTTFRLASPRIVPVKSEDDSFGECLHALEIANGALIVTLQMDNGTCSAAEKFAF
jgi:CheY-specific phosphatase CheX